MLPMSPPFPVKTTKVSCLKCAIKDSGNTLEPLYLCEEAASITRTSPPGSLATLISLRMDAIYAIRREGWNYHTCLLLQMWAKAYVYAEANPLATLGDLYGASMAPDQQTPVYSVESNKRFYPMFQRAISDRTAQTSSAGARLLRKALWAKMTSIRYINQQVLSLLTTPRDSPDYQMTAAFLGHGILGSLPHANSVAPPNVVIAFVKDPHESSERAVRQIGSKGLWYMVAEYISEVAYYFDDLYCLMKLCESRLPRPGDEWLAAVDKVFRPAFYSKFELPGETASIKRHLKNIPAPPAVAPLDNLTYCSEIQRRGIKRKLGVSVSKHVSPTALAAIYREAVSRSPRVPKISVPLCTELAERFSVPLDTVKTLVLHAIEQRGVFCGVRASEEVERAQREAHGGDCYLKACIYCHSIRERTRDPKKSKATSECIVHGSTSTTVLDEPYSLPEPSPDKGIRQLGPLVQCSNCRMFGGIVEVPA